jgi:hypothetical protein
MGIRAFIETEQWSMGNLWVFKFIKYSIYDWQRLRKEQGRFLPHFFLDIVT